MKIIPNPGMNMFIALRNSTRLLYSQIDAPAPARPTTTTVIFFGTFNFLSKAAEIEYSPESFVVQMLRINIMIPGTRSPFWLSTITITRLPLP